MSSKRIFSQIDFKPLAPKFNSIALKSFLISVYSGNPLGIHWDGFKPLLFWNEIESNIIDNYTKPTKYINI